MLTAGVLPLFAAGALLLLTAGVLLLLAAGVFPLLTAGVLLLVAAGVVEAAELRELLPVLVLRPLRVLLAEEVGLRALEKYKTNKHVRNILV